MKEYLNKKYLNFDAETIENAMKQHTALNKDR